MRQTTLQSSGMSGMALGKSTVATSDGFVFDIEAALDDYIRKNRSDERSVAIFKDLQVLSIPTVMNKYHNLSTGKALTKNGVMMIEQRVGGWVSNLIGHAYEPYLAAEKAQQFAGQLTRPPQWGGDARIHPDVVLDFLTGDFVVYSLKARYSATSQTMTMDIYDFHMEIDEWKRLASGRPGRYGKLVVVYYDHNIGKKAEKEMENPNKPPEKIRLSRVTGEPKINLIY